MSSHRNQMRTFIDRTQYWIGMCYMLAAGSNSSKKQSCIITDRTFNFICMSYDQNPVEFIQNNDSTIHAAINACFKINHASPYYAFVNHTPCYHCTMSLITNNIKKITYIKTTEPDARVVKIAQETFVQFTEFNQSLSWMKDWIKNLPNFDK